MADWYLSSVNYTAVAQFAINHAYSIGDFVRALAAPSASNEHVFRCTTAGTSAGAEPTWTMTNNGTTTSNTAVFTCITGQSAFGWSAPAGSLGALIGQGTGANRFSAGDRIFASSDHAQTKAATLTITGTGSITQAIPIISVNKAGSVPPVAADYLAGASFATTGANSITVEGGMRLAGCTINSGASINLASSVTRPIWLKDCALWLNNATAGSTISSANEPCAWTWQNTTVQFGAVGQTINLGSTAQGNTLDWFGTASALVGATMPTNLFNLSGTAAGIVTARGVDLSAMGSGKTIVNVTSASGVAQSWRGTFSNCKLGASVTKWANSNVGGVGPQVEFINCDSANTNYLCERHCSPQGDVTTETTITLTGGASDGTTTFSRKMVTTANTMGGSMPLEGFPMDAWNSSTGSGKTASVEIISSGTLTTADIHLQLEYLGDTGSCLSTVTDNGPANDLTAAVNVTASTGAWNSSPATPVTQKLQVTFTPQKVGAVRGTVCLKKPSTTVYVDPAMAIA